MPSTRTDETLSNGGCGGAARFAGGLLRRVAVGLLAALLGAAPAARAEGTRRALVIANCVYPVLAPLPVCAASAHVVSAALRRAGFEVTEQQNVTNGEMGAAITALVDAPGRAEPAWCCMSAATRLLMTGAISCCRPRRVSSATPTR